MTAPKSLQRIVQARRGEGWDRRPPESPDGHGPPLAVKRQPGRIFQWSVGWVGSHLTLDVSADGDTCAWWSHERFGDPIPLQAAASRRHLRWEDLPSDIQAAVRREVAIGPTAQMSTTNSAPLGR
jgi:hypothetical protein